MIKKLLFTVAMSLGMLNAVAQGRGNVIDEVIWVVGDEAILKSDVETARIDAIQQGQRWDGDPYCIIPEQLAVQKLFLTQAAIDSIEVSDADVFADVDADIQSMIMNAGSREKLEEYMNKSLSEIRSIMFDNYRDKMMVSEVQRNLVKDVKVSPSSGETVFQGFA